jgi:hypothetical protein
LLIEEQKDGRTDVTPPNLNPRSSTTQRANYEEFGKPAIRIGQSSVSFFRTMRLLWKIKFWKEWYTQPVLYLWLALPKPPRSQTQNALLNKIKPIWKLTAA